ncbi:MAG: hypothetical protein ABSF36_03165 [Candidatus Methanomethylicaceae archaeon]
MAGEKSLQRRLLRSIDLEFLLELQSQLATFQDNLEKLQRNLKEKEES